MNAPTPWDMTDATAEAVCAYEDGDTEAVAAFLAAATTAERACFTEEAGIIDAKRARAAAYRAPAAGSTIAACNAAAAEKSGAHRYEGAILRADERDESRWT